MSFQRGKSGKTQQWIIDKCGAIQLRTKPFASCVSFTLWGVTHKIIAPFQATKQCMDFHIYANQVTSLTFWQLRPKTRADTFFYLNKKLWRQLKAASLSLHARSFVLSVSSAGSKQRYIGLASSTQYKGRQKWVLMSYIHPFYASLEVWKNGSLSFHTTTGHSDMFLRDLLPTSADVPVKTFRTKRPFFSSAVQWMRNPFLKIWVCHVAAILFLSSWCLFLWAINLEGNIICVASTRGKCSPSSHFGHWTSKIIHLLWGKTRQRSCCGIHWG